MKITIGQFKALVREAVEEPDEKDMMISVYSDVYKEKNGIRPRWFMDELNAMTIDQVQAELDKLYDSPGMDDDYDFEPTPEFPEPESNVTPEELAGVDSREDLSTGEPMGMDHRPETRWHGPNIRKK